MQNITIANESFGIPDLEEGRHLASDGKYCAMELVAYLAGEKHSDQPECVCPVLSIFVSSCNDKMSSETRNKLLSPLLLDLIGTRSTKEIERQRAFILADWSVRTIAPIALRARGHDYTALLLRKRPAIVDEESAASAAAAAAAAADAAADGAAASAVADAAAAAAYAAAEAAYAAIFAAYVAVDAAASAAEATSYVSSISDDTWDLVPGLVQKLISVGDRDSMDLTKVAGRARKLNLCKS